MHAAVGAGNTERNLAFLKMGDMEKMLFWKF